MSIITSLTATPNRMWIIRTYLGQLGPSGVDVEELRRLLSPRSLRSRQTDEDPDSTGTSIGDQVIAEMRNLGLAERTPDGTLTVAASHPIEDEDGMLGYLEARLLEPASAEQSGQRSFPMALSWFLSQDPRSPLMWRSNYVAQVQADCGADTGSFELTNGARFQQFVYWARYLGFAWRMQIRNSNVVIPDPTAAIARHLPSVIGARGPRPLEEAMGDLAEILPVLEGGTARAQLEAMLTTHKRLGVGYLSPSTSFALQRLEQLGQVSLQRMADATAISLDLASGLRPVSHIDWRLES